MEKAFELELPVYNIYVDEEQSLEVDKVSIVCDPAVQSNFLKFSKQPLLNSLSFSGDDKKELLGVAIIPDMPIYRNVGGKEFYVVFNRDTIKTIAQNFFKKNYSNRMNIEHTEEDAESFIYQSYIVDQELGILPPKGLEEVPSGSWIIGVKVNSESLWEDIKSGKRNGFSVEGFFGLEELTPTVREDSEELQFLKAYDNLEKLIKSLR